MFTLLGVLGSMEIIFILISFLIYALPLLLVIILFNKIKNLERRVDELEKKQ